MTLTMADAYGMPPNPFKVFVRAILRAVSIATLGALPVERSVTTRVARDIWAS